MQPVLIVVLVLLCVLVLALMIPMAYGVATGNSPNIGCKIMASRLSISLFHPMISFAPFMPLCDVIFH